MDIPPFEPQSSTPDPVAVPPAPPTMPPPPVIASPATSSPPPDQPPIAPPPSITPPPQQPKKAENVKKLFLSALVFAVTFGIFVIAVQVRQNLFTTQNEAETNVKIEYMGKNPFVVKPGQGWLEHTKYIPNINNTSQDKTITPDKWDMFRCDGACPNFLQYHYNDVKDFGTLQPGRLIKLVNYLHDNPDDGRRTRILKNGNEVKVCEEGWVAPNCTYFVEEAAKYTVKFEDSVAMESIVEVPATPTPSPTRTVPTNTPVPTKTPTPKPSNTPTITPTPIPSATITLTPTPTICVTPGKVKNLRVSCPLCQ